MNRATRQSAERAGRISEYVAAIYLALKGYRLLAMRYRTRTGEIDLIGKRGGIIIFAEVKKRRSIANAADAVTFKSRRRIERAADLFMARHQEFAPCAMRYDIVAIANWRIAHIRQAWRYGE